jgi:predicted helicase
MENPIQVIIGNPPYSARQESQNDSNQNLVYESLDKRIRDTYAEYSTATNKGTLYDSYIRAFRWASDRLKGDGLISFVTNGSFLDSNTADGMRKCLLDEFTDLYIFNLRGNQRTSGELSRKEGGKIFGGGSRTPVVISMLVKNSSKEKTKTIHYRDIGDYLNREQKLNIISEAKSIDSIEWEIIKPNLNGDWINQRDPIFEKFISIGGKDDEKVKFFDEYSLGAVTSRDSWSYNFSKKILEKNIKQMINSYVKNMNDFIESKKSLKINSFEQKNEYQKYLNLDPKAISWSRSLKNLFSKDKLISFNKEAIALANYRPFTKQWVYFDKDLVESPSQQTKIFNLKSVDNVAIVTPGLGSTKDFSCFIVRDIVDFNFFNAGAVIFPKYFCDGKKQAVDDLFLAEDDASNNFINISKEIHSKFTEKFGDKVSTDDIFYYVYGVLHSNEYRDRFSSNLKKMSPRIPISKNFWEFSKAGQQLAELHLNYDLVEPFPLKQEGAINSNDSTTFTLTKLCHPKVGNKEDKSSIIYNGQIKLEGIPSAAYDYVINGKSAIEWIMERYQVTADKASGITNNPNDWSNENGDANYILLLIKRVVTVSLESMKIINDLPKLDELD